MSFSFGGITSGLDTAGMINDLMRVEAVPQSLTKGRIADARTRVEALQDLNTSIADLSRSLEGRTSAEEVALRSATSTDESVSATAQAGATPGSVEFTVQQVAQEHAVLSDAMSDGDGQDLVLTRTADEGQTETVTIEAGESLDDLVGALNEAGLDATKVAAGTDAEGQSLYRVQVGAGVTGAEGAFTLTDNVGQDFGFTLRQGQDAQVTMWGGTEAETTLASPTNTFSDVLTGVDITVSTPTVEPVAIQVDTDTEAISAQAGDLVDEISAVLNYIDVNTRAELDTDEEGNPTTTLGVFTSDSTISSVRQQIISAATSPVDGQSTAQVGISITRDGTVDFDQQALADALADDPDHVAGVLAQIGSRVASAADAASDRYEGSLTGAIQSGQDQIRDLNDQVADWDRRLAMRRETLEHTWAQLEVNLDQLQSQQQWLQGQLASLPTGGPQIGAM